MTQSHFCWVRLVDALADAKRTPVTYFHGDLAKLTPSMNMLFGERPPGVVESDSRADSPADSAKFLGVWTAAGEVFGREGVDTVFEYGPAFSNKVKALEWLVGPEGQVWDQFALNRFLMVFHAVVPPTNDRPDPDLCQGGFPEDNWTEEFKFKHRREPAAPLFHHKDLDTVLDAIWDSVKEHDECSAMPPADEIARTPKEDIYRESHSPVGAVASIMKLAGLSTDGTVVSPNQVQLKRLREWLIDAVEPSIYKLKSKYCRERPWSACTAVNSKLAERDHKCYPGHPSFPSGHATLAYVFAYLIGARRPDLATALECEAAAVARRREIAGLHFPSDSAAGKELARQMVNLMLDSGRNPNWAAFAPMLGLLD